MYCIIASSSDFVSFREFGEVSRRVGQPARRRARVFRGISYVLAIARMFSFLLFLIALRAKITLASARGKSIAYCGGIRG